MHGAVFDQQLQYFVHAFGVDLTIFRNRIVGEEVAQCGFGMFIAELEALEELGAGLVGVARGADDLDDLVQMLEGGQQAFEDVGALAGAGQVELAAATHDLEAVVVQLGTRGGLDPDSSYFLGVALREALTNAIRHGNGLAPSCPVQFRIALEDGCLSLTVRDWGPGFEASALPDPDAPENLHLGCGRGILFMRRFADEVVPPSELDDVLPSEAPKVPKREVQMAEELIDSLTSSFDPSAYRDEYREELLAMIERKAAGEEVVAAPEGVRLVEQHHPDVAIYTPVVDRELNSHKYIVPGLGDFGDRLYGTL